VPASRISIVQARFASVTAGSELTHWIVKPAVAEALSKIKKASGSAENLISFVEDGLKWWACLC
jgi:hypothetical protein